MAIAVRVVETHAGIRNVPARLPFRFGAITLRVAPLMTLAVTIEDRRGRRATGYASEMLAFRWFDKRPEKTLADNCSDLIRTVAVAAERYRAAGFDTPFGLWRQTHGEIERIGRADGFNRLGAGFGASMLERAVLDALGRLTGLSCFALVHQDQLGIDLAALSPTLAGIDPRSVLPQTPLERVAVRHTVGLVDPITAADVVPDEDPTDGLPVTLEDYLDRDRVRFLKVKIGGSVDADCARLEAIAAVLERRDRPIQISLDGNEQYPDFATFAALIEQLKRRPGLKPFYEQIIFIEQPLDREISLQPTIAADLASLDTDKPVTIDEADGWLGAFEAAIPLGYRGTSHKNCKGLYKSLGNLALATRHNQRVGRPELFLTAEDLSNLPVVALQADLTAVALLGIPHLERNGHHYFRGLAHLSPAEQADAVAYHPDLYERRGADVFLKIADGALALGSLQVPGMGFAALPDLAAMTPVEDWTFASLAGLSVA